MGSLRFILLLIAQCSIIFGQNPANEFENPAGMRQREVAEDRTEDTVDDTMKMEQLNAALADINHAGLDQKLSGLAAADDSTQGQSKSATSLMSMTLPRDCADILSVGMQTSGEYTVYVGRIRRPIRVYCDMATDGGGWLVFQRRSDGSEDFYRNWADYAVGFGSVNAEFWLGNNNLHSLTASGSYELRIDMEAWDGTARYASYSDFKMGSACNKYKLSSLGTYCGTAGDSLTPHLGRNFSTPDADNDNSVNSCATLYKGAWWYANCHSSNLNGFYFVGGTPAPFAEGVTWYNWKGHYYSLKFVEMKMRPNDM
jgi:hypothetical protein